MYRCFNISIKKEDFIGQSSKYIDEYREEGRAVKAELQKGIDSIFDSVTNADGVIDGGLLSDTWFPVSNTDVFLSYSHDDEDLALVITGMLKRMFGLTVFMDVLVWGNADDLLRNIDDRYCKKQNNTYSYEKRNFSTSHVHAMLTSAIMRAIDKAEAVFFLNTENSTYQLKNGFDVKHTRSPWIFEEIMFAKMVRSRDWTEHRQFRIDEMKHFQKELTIAYPLSVEGFTQLTYEDIVFWQTEWIKRKIKSSSYGVDFLAEHEKVIHALNVLYERVFGVDSGSKL